MTECPSAQPRNQGLQAATNQPGTDCGNWDGSSLERKSKIAPGQKNGRGGDSSEKRLLGKVLFADLQLTEFRYQRLA